MDLRKIKKLIEMLQESDLNEIEVKTVKQDTEMKSYLNRSSSQLDMWTWCGNGANHLTSA